VKRKPMKIGDVVEIGGIRVVCVPDCLLTRVGVDPETTGVMMPPEAADAMVAAMRSAGLIGGAAEPARSDSEPAPQNPPPSPTGDAE
jgi:hypothetical protein